MKSNASRVGEVKFKSVSYTDQVARRRCTPSLSFEEYHISALLLNLHPHVRRRQGLPAYMAPGWPWTLSLLHSLSPTLDSKIFLVPHGSLFKPVNHTF